MTKQNALLDTLNSQYKVTFSDAIFKKYQHLKISATNPINAPTPVITINGASISTEGNLTVLSGDSKSGKSALCNVIMAGSINKHGNDYDGFEGLEIAENIHGKAVIHVDTEQARHTQFKSLKNAILKRVNLEVEPDNFLSYNIRELDIKHYQSVCEDLFTAANERFGGIHLVIIDGGADFIKSVNDETDSNMIVHYFEQLAVKYKCPIIIIIHFNPNSEKQRGHLGSQLQRKAESVLAIKRNGLASYIEPQYLRGAGIADLPRIQFEFNKDKGYHTSCGLLNNSTKEEQNLKQMQEWVEKVFLEKPISYTEAVKELLKVTNLSDRTVKSRIKEMTDAELICKNADGLYEVTHSPTQSQIDFEV